MIMMISSPQTGLLAPRTAQPPWSPPPPAPSTTPGRGTPPTRYLSTILSTSVISTVFTYLQQYRGPQYNPTPRQQHKVTHWIVQSPLIKPGEAFCNFYYIHLFYNLQRRMGKKWVKNVFMIHKTINLYDKYKFQAPLTY